MSNALEKAKLVTEGMRHTFHKMSCGKLDLTELLAMVDELQAQLAEQAEASEMVMDACLKAEAQLAAGRALTVFDADGDSSLQFISRKALLAAIGEGKT